jgi:lipopolysaccharide heptosyltransferase II
MTNLLMESAQIRRILVIKLRAIGDVVLSTIVLKNVRSAFPESRIVFLTEPASADVLRGNPSVNETLIYDRSTMSGWRLIRAVRKEAFDLVIDLFGNPRTALVTRLSGARHRVGFRFRGRKYAYNIVVEPRGAQVHNTQFNLDALAAIGVPIVDRTITFAVDPDDEQYVDAFLGRTFAEGTLLAGINAGGGWYTKRWELEKYAALADALMDRYGLRPVLLWGPGQLADVERMRAMMKSEAFVPPATTLKQLGALLRRCAIIVTNDSGPLHIAAAVGTPVVGIYGPTNPVLQGPYGNQYTIVRNESLDCLGCNYTSCPIEHQCMRDLTVAQVLAAVDSLLSHLHLATPHKESSR